MIPVELPSLPMRCLSGCLQPWRHSAGRTVYGISTGTDANCFLHPVLNWWSNLYEGSNIISHLIKCPTHLIIRKFINCTLDSLNFAYCEMEHCSATKISVSCSVCGLRGGHRGYTVLSFKMSTWSRQS